MRDPRQVRQELAEFTRPVLRPGDQCDETCTADCGHCKGYGVRAGDRVVLLRTNDPHTRLAPGDQGTVMYTRFDGVGRVVGVNWDSGSGLAMLLDEGDAIRKVDA